MTASSLADRLISGGDPATAEELLLLLREAPREELREAAHRVTATFAPKHFDFCSIVNARSGRCPENCKWCAQSARWPTDAPCHGWIGADACLRAARAPELSDALRSIGFAYVSLDLRGYRTGSLNEALGASVRSDE